MNCKDTVGDTCAAVTSLDFALQINQNVSLTHCHLTFVTTLLDKQAKEMGDTAL